MLLLWRAGPATQAGLLLFSPPPSALFSFSPAQFFRNSEKKLRNVCRKPLVCIQLATSTRDVDAVFINFPHFAWNKPHRDSSSVWVLECVINSLRAEEQQNDAQTKKLNEFWLPFQVLLFIAQISKRERKVHWDAEISTSQRCLRQSLGG